MNFASTFTTRSTKSLDLANSALESNAVGIPQPYHSGGCLVRVVAYCKVNFTNIEAFLAYGSCNQDVELSSLKALD